MKKQLLALIFTLFLTNFVLSQTISFTSSELSTAAAGSTITVNYQYTISNNGYIYCAINLLNEWTYISTVASAELNPAVAGTNVSGSFQMTIPANTTPTANLTGNQNYKISIELKDSNFVWQAGAYPATQINITSALSDRDFKSESFSVFPNPTSDFIYVTGNNKDSISKISISDMLGKNVLTSSQLINEKIDVSSLNSGIYILTVSSDNSQKTLKFIKK